MTSFYGEQKKTGQILDGLREEWCIFFKSLDSKIACMYECTYNTYIHNTNTNQHIHTPSILHDVCSVLASKLSKLTSNLGSLVLFPFCIFPFLHHSSSLSLSLSYTHTRTLSFSFSLSIYLSIHISINIHSLSLSL